MRGPLTGLVQISMKCVVLFVTPRPRDISLHLTTGNLSQNYVYIYIYV